MLEYIFRPLVALLSYSPWLDAALALIVGVTLVFARSRHRGLYGAAEVVFGMMVASLAVVRMLPVDLEKIDFNAADFATIGVEVSIIQFVTSVFIVVRGLDNIRLWMDEPSPA